MKKQKNKNKNKQLRKSYLENHNYDPSRAKCYCYHENETLFYSNGVRLKMPTHRGIFSLLVRLEDLKPAVPMKRELLVLK